MLVVKPMMWRFRGTDLESFDMRGFDVGQVISEYQARVRNTCISVALEDRCLLFLVSGLRVLREGNREYKSFVGVESQESV